MKVKKKHSYAKMENTSAGDNPVLYDSEEKDGGSNQRKEKICRKGNENNGDFKTTIMSTEDNLLHEREETETSVKGMKKWLLDYHSKRPGLKELQRRIDDFIVDYEAKAEKERKEHQAAAASDGWTVVTHMKGRKKNVDSDTGIAVGSVSEAAVHANQVKKKSDGTVMDFYRFQRREARRNEVLELQKQFEEDKKRIAKMRAARKFRPY